MKKLLSGMFIVISFLGFRVQEVTANPIIWNPLAISEFFVDSSGNWVLELYIIEDPLLMSGDSTLDQFRILTNTDTAVFNQGTVIHQGDVLIINSSSLLSELNINKNNDNIRFQYNDFNDWSDCGIPMIISNDVGPFHVPPVDDMQSVQLLMFSYLVYPISQTEYYYVTSNYRNPGIFIPVSTFCTGSFEGTVYDANHNPVPPGIITWSYYPAVPDMPNVGTITGPDGHFSLFLYAKKYEMNFLYMGNSIFTTTFLLEPDSLLECEFVLDTLFAGIHENSSLVPSTLSNFPNPFSGNTSIHIRLGSTLKPARAILKVYNSMDEIVGILPVTTDNRQQEEISVPFSADKFSLSPGNYYCTLELDGKRAASCKMVVLP